MPAKQPVTKPTESPDSQGRFWQPPEQRGRISDEGRKWQKENAEAAEAWAKWVETNGVPLRPLF